MSTIIDKTVRQTRFYRRLHKWLAVPLFAFMFLMGLSGLLLGWKKQTGLLPPTAKGASVQSRDWLSIHRIETIAHRFADSLRLSPDIDRIDIRPAKGIAKIVFTNHFTEIQIDCQTGAIVSVARRNSDFIEKIHDGSLLDFGLGLKSDQIKLTYTTALSLGLILLSVSGFWLWYNPKRIKGYKARQGVGV